MWSPGPGVVELGQTGLDWVKMDTVFLLVSFGAAQVEQQLLLLFFWLPGTSPAHYVFMVVFGTEGAWPFAHVHTRKKDCGLFQCPCLQ